MSVTGDLVTLRGGRTYAMGSVPDGPTYPYAVIGYAPNAPVVRTTIGGGDQLRRFTVQHFARSSDGVEEIAADTFEAFEGQPVLDGICWQEIASPITRDPDNQGVLSTTHTYRF